uniref:Uncharacterized protein n=1 Tax=Aegilops tauschii subsp. strangulata TaxID=200361 RepID=A0A453KPY7_AEGTS
MLPARFLKLSLLCRLGAARAAGVPPPWQTRQFPVRGFQSRGYSAGGSSKYDRPMRQFAEENESNSRPLIYYIVPSAILAFAGLATYVHYNDEKRAVPLGVNKHNRTVFPKGALPTDLQSEDHLSSMIQKTMW